MTKKNESKIPIGAILIGLIIGFVIMFFIYPLINPTKVATAPIAINDARVLEVEGILIFIRSEPEAPKTVLGALTQEKVLQIIDKLEGIENNKNKGFLEKIEDEVGEVWKNVNMQERIIKFVRVAKNEYPGVQGLVFNGSNLKEADAIKFN